MKKFKNILVGVDLSAGDKLVSQDLSPPTLEAIERALWLAKLSEGNLTFFYSLDIGPQAQHSIEEDSDIASTVLGKAEAELLRLVERARSQRISAELKVQFGKSWLELIRQVLRNKHDLVLVGSKSRNVFERFFIGSTGIKLLRNCPCPVWVTQPARSKSGNVLVAHDLTEVGSRALELGASMAELERVPLHVVHALETLRLSPTDPVAAVPDADDQTVEAAKQRIENELMAFPLVKNVQVHAEIGSPEEVLLKCIEQHDIDLTVMGTCARCGMDAWMFGNTAERMLPHIPCSVLAVKPAEFQSQITLE